MSRTIIPLLTSALLVSACGSDDPPTPMKLSLFKVTDSCALQVAGDTPDLILELPFKTCDSSGDPTVIAGGTRLELLVDYGTIDFTEGTSVPAPTITMTLDGAASPATLSATRLPEGRRAAFGASFVAPAQSGAQLAFIVTATTGFDQDLGGVTLAAPDLTMTIDPCPATGTCSLVSSVGTVTTHVTVAGATKQTVTVTSSVDGITQPDAVTITADQQISPDHVSGFASLPVPAGGTWQLTARSGQASVLGPSIALSSPTVTSLVTCGTMCKAGSTAELVVTAPRLVHPPSATVDITVGGAPLVASGSLMLTEPDIATNTISGRMQVIFPTAVSASVIVDADVAGYRATTIQTVLQ
jgi:hypothetical protein